MTNNTNNGEKSSRPSPLDMAVAHKKSQLRQEDGYVSTSDKVAYEEQLARRARNLLGIDSPLHDNAPFERGTLGSFLERNDPELLERLNKIAMEQLGREDPEDIQKTAKRAGSVDEAIDNFSDNDLTAEQKQQIGLSFEIMQLVNDAVDSDGIFTTKYAPDLAVHGNDVRKASEGNGTSGVSGVKNESLGALTVFITDDDGKIKAMAYDRIDPVRNTGDTVQGNYAAYIFRYDEVTMSPELIDMIQSGNFTHQDILDMRQTAPNRRVFHTGKNAEIASRISTYLDMPYEDFTDENTRPSRHRLYAGILAGALKGVDAVATPDRHL